MFRKLLSVAMVGAVVLGCASFVEAGSVRGPRLGSETISARSVDTFTIVFYGGELAKVGVLGDGVTDLDLYVYDENGNLIASDTRDSDRCFVSFTPKWTGAFTIKVVNRGWVYNHYTLGVN